MILSLLFITLGGSSNSFISGGQATDWDVESMLEDDDDNGVEVSDEVLGLFNEESGSEMESEAPSVVELSVGDNVKVIRPSLATKPTVEKEQSEIQPLHTHKQSSSRLAELESTSSLLCSAVDSQSFSLARTIFTRGLVKGDRNLTSL